MSQKSDQKAKPSRRYLYGASSSVRPSRLLVEECGARSTEPKGDHHSYSQRTRFIPDELLSHFEQVNAVKSKMDFKRDAMASDVTTADVRRKIGKMWA